MAQHIADSLSQADRDLLADVYERRQHAHGEEFLGMLLTGSAGRGMATHHSDIDVMVVLGDAAGAGERTSHSPRIDEIPVPWSELVTLEPYGTEGWFGRWAFAWTPVLIDKTVGEIPRLAAVQARVDAHEAEAILFDHDRLDGWINYAYRALKSDRDGRPAESRLDAAESLPWLLDVVFTLAGRVRPYNKYLAWELAHHPLHGWEDVDLLHLAHRTIAGDPAALRTAHTHVRGLCARDDRLRERTHATFTSWGTDLAIFDEP